MKKISLQWRLTCIITLYIAVICGCLTLLVYKNGIYYIDSLQETVDARGDDAEDQDGDGATDGSDQIYKKYTSPYQRISGMSSQMIFLFKCTIIKKTTKETV